MQRILIAAAVVAFLVSHTAAQAPPAKPVELKTLKDKASYSIGLNIGNGIKSQGFDLDVNLLAQGIRDALGGGKTLLTEEQINEVMTQFQQQAMTAATERAKVEGEKNKKDADAYLAGNAKKEGVKSLPSGLQYKVLKTGAGKKPTSKDTVTTHYTGTLINGEVFDSSVKRNEPATFPVSGVIRGWTEALQLMSVGSKWQLFVPADLAYGAEGRPPVIPPNAMLIFEVELLEIKGPELPKLQ